MDPITEARKRGWPLTAQEIIQERVEFEDRILRKNETVEHPPEVMRKELSSQRWTPTARYVFGRGVMRFAYSLMP